LHLGFEQKYFMVIYYAEYNVFLIVFAVMQTIYLIYEKLKKVNAQCY